MKKSLLSVFLLAASAAANGETMSDSDLKALVRDSVRFLEDKNDKSPLYAYTVRNQRRQFDSDGKLKQDESTVVQRTFQDGFPVSRLLERNGKPLTEQEKKDNEDRLAARLAELKGMSPSERDAQRKKSRRGSEWVKEIPEALKYRIAGDETIDGRRCWIIHAEPNPSYRPANMQARVFEKMKGKFWVDKTDRELVRGEAETFDSVSIGLGILARVEKGTRFDLHRIKLPDGNWVTESQRLKFGARVMLFKWMSNEIETRMYDYRHQSQVTTAAVR